MDDQQQFLGLLFGVFGFLVTVLGLAPIVSSHLSQRRDRHTQETLLQGSADTIRLVNDTLRLAKDASERASASMERKARANLDDLDTAAQDLILRSTHKDDRDIVANPNNRTELEALAGRVDGFDIYTVVLDERVSLTPSCLFIKGMNSHLRQHFYEALRIWRQCALASSDNSLKSLSWYWIGYENNNLAHFSDARNSFEEARKHAEQDRALELKRISIETMFFDREHFTTEQALEDMLLLLAEAEGKSEEYGLRKYIDGVRLTAGNMQYVCGKELLASGNMDRGRAALREAKTTFGSIRSQNKWSQLGYAQCCLLLSEDVEKARDILTTKVRPAAQDEFVRRVEPRSKVLARTTELICALAAGKPKADIDAQYGLVLSALGDVDNRLTLYSLMQRRNVDKDEFRSDLDAMVNDGTGA